MGAILECRGICKTYGTGELAEPVLTGVSLALPRSQACILLGPSGSGKTTLLSILGCLLRPTCGQLRINGRDVADETATGLAQLRRQQIGFVFQQAQLLPFLTAAENVALVARNSGQARAEATRRTQVLLERLGLRDVRRKKPAQMSGGQRQRVAIARALVHRPALLLADEPTAALDWDNGQAAVGLLLEQARAEHVLLLVVSHDTRLVPRFDRVFHMNAGKLSET
jgi:putative ABC transport system ATP-binding protein